MKEFWSILMEKLKLVEHNYAALGMAVSGLLVLAMTAGVIKSLFNMIVDIVLAFNSQPLG